MVYFFKGQVGRGKVPWDALAADANDPWDGVGLGGSQKCEVAYLEHMGFEYIEADIADFLDGRMPQAQAPQMIRAAQDISF